MPAGATDTGYAVPAVAVGGAVTVPVGTAAVLSWTDALPEPVRPEEVFLAVAVAVAVTLTGPETVEAQVRMTVAVVTPVSVHAGWLVAQPRPRCRCSWP